MFHVTVLLDMDPVSIFAEQQEVMRPSGESTRFPVKKTQYFPSKVVTSGQNRTNPIAGQMHGHRTTRAHRQAL